MIALVVIGSVFFVHSIGSASTQITENPQACGDDWQLTLKRSHIDGDSVALTQIAAL
jgi:hypothetical protein